MVFPWHVTTLPQELTQTFGQRADAAIRQELKDRAGILHRLGYSEKEVTERLSTALRWEFELNGTPAVLKDVASVVGSVFNRGPQAAAANAAPAKKK